MPTDSNSYSIDGDKLPFEAWRGRPVLVVNTASFCGYTPQYSDLEALWQRYRGRGLVVLGVPSNDFGAQEPGSAAEIKRFCATNYAVDFPLTEKCRVIGGEAHPFYRWIAADTRRGRHAALELSQIPGRARRPARRHLAVASRPERPPNHRRNRAAVAVGTRSSAGSRLDARREGGGARGGQIARRSPTVLTASISRLPRISIS